MPGAAASTDRVLAVRPELGPPAFRARVARPSYPTPQYGTPSSDGNRDTPYSRVELPTDPSQQWSLYQTGNFHAPISCTQAQTCADVPTGEDEASGGSLPQVSWQENCRSAG